MKAILYLIVFIGLSYLAVSQIAKDQVVMLNAKANPNGSITLSWPKINYSGGYYIYRRGSFAIQSWGVDPVANVPGDSSSWTDLNFNFGDSYEYLVAKHRNDTTDALGYIYAGNKKTEIAEMGNLILLIDSTYILPLAQEIQTLTNDLNSEGWIVYPMYAGRTEMAANVKDRIAQIYNDLNSNVRTLFILGHVPVPYSGYFSTNGTAPPPDGHVEGVGNHTGAWPADVYYGDFIGMWSDYSVSCTTGVYTRNHNVPGDGKFDQSKLPYTVQLEVGRVDLFDMPSFKKSDTLLMKEYLNRDHLFRTGQWTETERALIDNNFEGLNLASTGYQNFAAFFPFDSITDDKTKIDYIPSQKQNSYLWSFGCGGGSETSCGGIGNTVDFVSGTFHNIFTMLSGSFFGDWDHPDNFLRAPLASNSLACFWGGIPKWYVHHMAMGMDIGYGAKISQNNINFYFSGGFNYSWYSVHIALMGDPTLKLKNVSPPTGLNATTTVENIFLNWKKSPLNVDGYCIFKVDTLTNEYVRVNPEIITDTFYVDKSNHASGSYKYAVRAIKLETTASGTYYNLSGGPFVEFDYVSGVADLNNLKDKIKVFPSVAQSKIFINSEIQGKARLLDLTGRILNEIDFVNNAEIDIDQYVPGIYFVQIIGDDAKSFNFKVIKQ